MRARMAKYGAMKRMSTKVDFTPMVDMNMLLLTFFMLCTTLSKPQVMDLVMPAPTTDVVINTPASVSITLLLGGQDDLYYYEGMPDYKDYTSLKKINYDELRNVLAQKNRHIIVQVNDVRKKLDDKTINEQQYKEMVKEIKKQKEGVVAIIKPMDKSVYNNLVDVLDEMVICNIGKYAVLDITDGDKFLLSNYEAKGSLPQNYPVFQ